METEQTHEAEGSGEQRAVNRELEEQGEGGGGGGGGGGREQRQSTFHKALSSVDKGLSSLHIAAAAPCLHTAHAPAPGRTTEGATGGEADCAVVVADCGQLPLICDTFDPFGS